MREFIYFSNSARTSGNFNVNDLMKAGRMDIAIHTIIAAFFLSHKVREDVKMHLVFYGMPDPPKHIEIQTNKELELSKKDVAGLLKKILYKYPKNLSKKNFGATKSDCSSTLASGGEDFVGKEGKKIEVLSGCFIEKKSLLKVIEQLKDKGKEIYVLDQNGEDIRKLKIEKNPVFLLGDQDGFPAKELKRLKELCTAVSIGKNIYFASHTLAIVQNELDRRGV